MSIGLSKTFRLAYQLYYASKSFSSNFVCVNGARVRFFSNSNRSNSYVMNHAFVVAHVGS